MDLIEKFLREVPRDSDGFEDLEAFWNDAGKVFPCLFYSFFIEILLFVLREN